MQIDRPVHLRGATFPALLRLGRIDHVFVDPAIQGARVAVDDSPLARVASDHLPVVVDLEFADRMAQ